MAVPEKARFRNRLLCALPDDALSLLERHLAPIALPRRLHLEQPNRALGHVYFIENGIASTVASRAPAAQLEVGIVGCEGMTGMAVIHAADRSPYAVYMQVGGNGYRVEARVLSDAMNKSANARRVFLAFAQVFLIQVAETAVANARATIGERLARWLLMVHDRVGRDEIPLTHEFLALMMGARRPGVTEAINELSRRGFVATERGKITVIDRAALVKQAGQFYGVPERELKRLFD